MGDSIYYIDQATILKAAIKLFGEKVQVSNPCYIDDEEKTITFFITAYHARSFKAKFYYKKASFDYKDADLTT